MNILDDAVTWNAKPSDSVLSMQQKVVEELKPKQKAKVEQLRLALNDVLKPCHNDFFLLRWLKARKFDVSQAEKSIRTNLKWREEMQMDNLHEVFKPPEAVWKYYPLGLSGQAKNGNLVWIMKMGQMDIRGYVYSAKFADRDKFCISIYEYMQRMTPMQSEKIGKVVTSQTIIVDFEGFKIQDYLWKPALQVSLSLMKHLAAHYPDVFDTVFVVNAPRVFTIFNAMLKPFQGEETRNAIKVYGKESWKEALLEAIDADQLPVHWGGTQVDQVDGNPYCSSKIGIGGPVPKSCYLGLSRRDPSKNALLATTTIDAKKSFTMDFHVNTPGSTLTWIFGTEDSDIAFGVKYQPPNGSAFIEIIPIEKMDCHLAPEEGTLLCDQAGLYIVTLDNSYSWMKSKKVYYDINLRAPNTETNSHN